jgi:hypothetical protein
MFDPAMDLSNGGPHGDQGIGHAAGIAVLGKNGESLEISIVTLSE